MRIATEWDNPSNVARAKRAVDARRALKRPPKLDPTTSDIEYTHDELEFMNAVHDYIRRTGRKFPTWREALHILESLGYHK